jgi:tripartite ATP-independent transporter DctM subunit
MDPVLIGILCLIGLLVLLALGNYVAVALGIVAMGGYMILTSPNIGLSLMQKGPYILASKFTLVAIPLFILMGHFMLEAGVGEDIYFVAHRWLGQVKGGLAMATTAGCAAFGVASGSSAAATVTLTKVSLPEMLKFGYDKKLATGAIAASGTLASMIPPSGLMIVYGVLTQESIGRLFMAGVIPGIASALIYMATILVLVSFRPQLAPTSPPFPWIERIRSLGRVWSLVVIAVIVLGGIYFGVVTPTEAGALGALGALALLLVRKGFSGKRLLNALEDAAQTTAMIFAILIMALILGRFLAISRISTGLIDVVGGLNIPPLGIICGFLVLYIFLGMFLDPGSMMAITLPFLFPIVAGLGFDGVWFGILVIRACEIGLITPPVGMNVYTVHAATEGQVELTDIFRGIVPFLLAEFLTLGLLVAFPQLSLWLPGMMVG